MKDNKNHVCDGNLFNRPCPNISSCEWHRLWNVKNALGNTTLTDVRINADLCMKNGFEHLKEIINVS